MLILNLNSITSPLIYHQSIKGKETVSNWDKQNIQGCCLKMVHYLQYMVVSIYLQFLVRLTLSWDPTVVPGEVLEFTSFWCRPFKVIHTAIVRSVHENWSTVIIACNVNRPMVHFHTRSPCYCLCRILQLLECGAVLNL